jgi:hypothetical protein
MTHWRKRCGSRGVQAFTHPSQVDDSFGMVRRGPAFGVGKGLVDIGFTRGCACTRSRLRGAQQRTGMEYRAVS